LKNIKKKILIRTGGGQAKNKELGLGHVFRVINLSNFLKNHEIHFMIEDFGGASKILRENNFHRISILDKKYSVKKDIKKTVSYIKKNSIDMIIIDRYRISSSYVKTLQKLVKTVVISDLENIGYNADLIVNGFIGYKNQIRKNRYGSRCLLGSKYQILNKNFNSKRKSKNKKFDILATFGGFDEKHIADLFVKIMIKNNFHLKTKVILGPATKRSSYMTRINKKHISWLTIVKSSNNLFSDILQSKYGLCSGGITTYEFALCRVPFGIISQNKHQKITAKEWERKGNAVNLGLINNTTTKNIERFIEYIRTNKKFSKQKILDEHGAKRVAHEIIH